MAELSVGPTAGTVDASTKMPLCGIAAGTIILTLAGAMPIEFVAPGDKIITRSGARAVTGVEIAVVKNASVIRISEGVLGKDRPEADMIVAPQQPLLIRDWRAKAMTGVDQAVMRADRLVDGAYIRSETVAEARIVTLHFADPQVIFAAGLELGCETAVQRG
ncbi:MAG: Hint domain-containing protein [Pseudotabrizicola sp.]|uniref:Hint domain-containing protein n=1 Tax=Pseudotabrizicola sp. TaxID=2939647 RepID=UPI002718928A|nr:Hint domain-containing protein [Pseudotabrizicola sp.]MDO8884837.1 Hint domain-containing protein [Pseudotabrizicola sp.]MDP2083115.1 Hint domain-containing protein [Pseudotabrizicola sp.]MDZ7572533.1 Hint domain-containing protein [Pseudotabrizicola sp.]